MAEPAEDEVRREKGMVARAGVLLPFPLAVATFVLGYWCVDITSPTLPVLQKSLDLSDTVAGLVVAIFFGGRLVANFPAAVLVERVGSRVTAAAGGGLMVVGSVIAANAGSELTLLPARAFQGAGVSLLVMAALLSTLRARPGQGSAMTVFNVASGVGGACGLISGGFLAEDVSWRAVFWLCTGLGTLLAIGALFAGTRTAGRRDRGTPRAKDGETERREDGKISRWEMAVALGANLLVYGNYSIFVVGLPLYADEHFDASSGRIGLLLLMTNLMHFGGAFPGGRFVRRWGSTRVLIPSFAVVAAGMLLCLAAPGFFWMAPGMGLYAVGSVACNIAAGDQLLRLGGQGGRAIGLMRLTSDIGLVVGPAAVGALADVAGAAAPFVVLAILSAAAALTVARDAGGRRTSLGGPAL